MASEIMPGPKPCRAISLGRGGVEIAVGVLMGFRLRPALDQCFIADEMLEHLPVASRVGKTLVGGIDLNKARMRQVVEALIALSPSPNGFTASDVAGRVRALSKQSPCQYGPRHAAYDLKKLRGKHIARRIPGRCDAALMERCEDRARADGVHTNAVRRVVGGERSRQAGDRGLGGVVLHVAATCDDGTHGGDVNDGATLVAAHQRNRRLGTEDVAHGSG